MVEPAPVDTTTMQEEWEVAYMMRETDQAGSPPEHIARCAAYKVDQAASNALASQFARTMGAVEQFYCMAYKIDLADRRAFQGRVAPGKRKNSSGQRACPA